MVKVGINFRINYGMGFGIYKRGKVNGFIIYKRRR